MSVPILIVSLLDYPPPTPHPLERWRLSAAWRCVGATTCCTFAVCQTRTENQYYTVSHTVSSRSSTSGLMPRWTAAKRLVWLLARAAPASPLHPRLPAPLRPPRSAPLRPSAPSRGSCTRQHARGQPSLAVSFVCRKSGDQGGCTPGQLLDCSTCIRSL